MSAAEDVPQSSVDEDSRSRSSTSRPGKEKKRRRRSRSKQKEATASESQFFEQDYPADDDDNSCSSTPKYERSEEPIFPSGGFTCALCYCGEKSLLGQGDLTRYSPTAGFNPFKKPPLRARGSREILYGSSPGSNGSQDSYNTGEKVTKTAAVQRRGSKQMRDTVKPTIKPEDKYIDELSTVGCSEMLDVSLVFEPAGHVTAHHCCAAWSEGVTQNESYNLLCVDKAVHSGMSQRCHSCSRYGATIKCRAPKCERLFHYPCAAGSGCYQDIKSMSLLCTDHLELAPTIADPDELNCAVCDDPGQISDLLFCTSCGHHYHGDCLDPHVDVNPVVRAGWQCPECKICQTCRQPGDDNKMLVCDVCDKGYHTFCLRPAMSFIPKNGWCCKNCRRCTDCGSRTPGNGPSSRWHINYQVCDKCYQLRNKGSSCPVCGRAYRNIPGGRMEMTHCTGCKKWVHWGCEDPSQLESCQKPAEDYKCPRCRNPSSVPLSQTSSPSSQPVPPEMSSQGLVTDPHTAEIAPQDLIEGTTTSKTETPEEMEEDKHEAEERKDVASEMPPITMQSPTPTVRKRASTSSSIGSDKGTFALKGSSLDPMLCVGEDSASDVNDPHSLSKSNVGSPPRKVRHLSSDDAISTREKTDRHSSAESSNMSSLFTDENAQDAMSLFGVESLPHSTSLKSTPPPVISSTNVMNPDGKSYKIPDTFVSPGQPKVSLSPLGSPASYGSPPSKPPGPGLGKPGGMYGKGKPLGHKRKPAAARSKGKGKGKGQKRAGFSGPKKRPRGGMAGKGASMPQTGIDRNFPRRARRGFQRQCSTASTPADPGPLSPTTRVEPALQTPQADDEYGDSMHNTVVLCSTEDTFTLSQDMCVICGSFGKGSEGRLISCSQCGQCYHPYCVNLKLTKVVLRKGWRCLDCTVCEECGQVDDPAHLLLCDDCDISYHTHCLRPPLQHVPKGGWKCKWCVRCVHCGTTSPGKNCEWASNYTSCGPCASLNHCPKCRRSYKDEDIIMQCGTCERWLHAVCECLFTESDIEKVLEKGYDCCFCRPKDATPPHLTLGRPSVDPLYGGSQTGVYLGRTRSEVETVKEFQKDYTSLTISGLQHIQRQMQKYMGLYKKRPAGPRGVRKSSEVQSKTAEPSPVKPVTDATKPAESLGQPINVEAAVTALQEPGDVNRNANEESTTKPPELPVDGHPIQLPVSTAIIKDLSSATATATEDSGMEGIEKENQSAQPGEIKSPLVGVDDTTAGIQKSEEFEMEASVPVVVDPTRKVLGIKKDEKRRRKPYRPGIGGFTVRQRGRGGLLKPRSRRPAHVPPAVDKTSTNDSRTDTVGSETVSDTTGPPLHVPYDLVGQGGSNVGLSSQPGGTGQPQFNPPLTAEPNVSLVSPLKLKITSPTTTTSTTKKRKKRMKLIDQFPPYLQDAFFGKKIITDAKAKGSPLDDLNEQPASPGEGYGAKHGSDSRLILPDRLTQRLEAQAAHQAASLANAGQSSSSHGNTRSQRHPSQPQDEDAMLNEQDLLGVLPDLPFKDDELLGMFSTSDLKPEQGANDSHENILSPSALEKMVRDGLENIDSSDMAALFSDVLTHQPDGTIKQENASHGESSDNAANVQQHGILSPDKIQDVKQSSQSHMIQQQHSRSVPTSVMQMQQTNDPAQQQQQQIEEQRKLAIQQELQEIEIKQRQQHLHRQHAIQRQMSANIPPTGFSMNQPDQNLSGHQIINMGQNRQALGPSVTPGPHGMPMMPQHMDPSRPRSHHTTPVMSPVPMMGQQPGHPMSQQIPPGHSPHQTPPPPPIFARQTSMPILSTAQNTVQNEIQQIHQQMQMQGQLGPRQAIPKGPIGARPMIVQSPTTGTIEMHNIQAMTSASRSPAVFHDQTASSGNIIVQHQPGMQQNVGVHSHQGTSRFPSPQHQGGQPKFQPSGLPVQQSQKMPLPPEAYLTGPSVTGQDQGVTNMVGPSGAMPAPTHKRSSSVPVAHGGMVSTTTEIVNTAPGIDIPPSLGTVTQSMVQPMPAQITVSTQGGKSVPVSSTPPMSQSGEILPGPSTPLPDFSSDANLFEPAPPPWPLGTELDGDCMSVNQRNLLKWEKDEPLGELSTISPVLYANVKFPNLKQEMPDWQTRAKHIAKLWRKATPEDRAPFLLKARDNRSLLKISRTRKVETNKTPPMITEETEVKTSATESIKQEKTDDILMKPAVSQHSTPPMPVSSQVTPSSISQSIDATTGKIEMSSDQHSFAKPDSRTTTPKPPSPGAAQLPSATVPSQTLPPDYITTVKQQPRTVPVSAYFAGQTTEPGQMETAQTSQKQSPVKITHAKTERRPSLDIQAFPMQPTVQESPTKSATVTRSLSVGAPLPESMFPHSGTPKGKAPGTPSSKTPPMDAKNRRLSVDSQVLQLSSPMETDIKPQIQMSPTPAHIRQVIYQPSSHRNSRRARLWEQSQPPPPPYPSHTSQAPVVTPNTPGFMYPRGQMMQMQGPRVGVLTQAAHGMLRTPPPSMMAFPFEGQSSLPPGHAMAHQNFPPNMHGVKGFPPAAQHPPGAYIELRHSNQTDPAIRRQNILRIGNVCSTGSTPSQPQPVATPEQSLSSEGKTTTSSILSKPAEVSVQQPTGVAPSTSEHKSEDPFAGGHLPHDEYLDALLRSDEFKDLHFQGPGTSTTLAGKTQTLVSSSSVSSSTQMVTLTSHTAIKSSSPEISKPVQATEATKPDLEKENDNTQKSAESTKEAVKADSAVEQSEHEKVDEEKGDEAIVKDGKGNAETKATEPAEDTSTDSKGKDMPVVLKNDHSYFKSKEMKSNIDENKNIESKMEEKKDIDQEKPKLNVDIDKCGTSLSGVGLTPPPDSEVAMFVPSEEEPRREASGDLNVSNVIIVPGTPPCGTPVSKTLSNESRESKQDSKEAITEKNDSTENENKDNENKQESKENEQGVEKTESEVKEKKEGESKDSPDSKSDSGNQVTQPPVPDINSGIDQSKEDRYSIDYSYDIQPLPKSPVPPPVRNLAKFAKIPDPPVQKQNQRGNACDKEESDQKIQQKPETDLSTPKTVETEKMEVMKKSITEDGRVTNVLTSTSQSENTETPISISSTVQAVTTTSVTSIISPVSTTTSSIAKDLATSDNTEQKTSESEDAKTSQVEQKQVEIDKGDQPEQKTSDPYVPQLSVSVPTISSVSDDKISSEDNTGVTTPSSVHSMTAAPPFPMPAFAISSATPMTIVPSVTQTMEQAVSNSIVSSASGTSKADTAGIMEVAQPVESGEAPPSTSVASTENSLQPMITPATISSEVLTTPYPIPGVPTSQSILEAENMKTPTRPMPPPAVQTSVSPTQTTQISPSKDESKSTTTLSTTTPPRPKPLLIKEQPLLLQDLLEEEKREQEKARREKMRHSQTLLQQQVAVPQPGGMPPGVFPTPVPQEMTKVTPESGIDNIKMEFLSKMNQATQAGLPVVPPSGPDGGIVASGTSPLHQQSQQGHWPPHMGGMQQGIHGFGNDNEMRKYRSWLIQHQQLMQIQVPKQEQLVQSKKTRKQSLMKKRNQYKRNGKEFSADDTEELRVVTKQYTEAQQQLEKLRNEQKQHAELIQEFNIKQRHMMGAMSAGPPGSIVQQQVIDNQGQQQMMIQQPVTPGMQHQPHQIIVPPFQTPGNMQPGTTMQPGVVPVQSGAGGIIQGSGQEQNMPQQQLVIMQQGQQQVIIKNIPASTNIGVASSSSTQSVAMGMAQQQQQQQQSHVVMATPQQIQQFQAQFQKMNRISPTQPTQFQQIMMNKQHQFQQQQLQIQQNAQIQQLSLLKPNQPRPQFMTSQPEQSTPHSTVSVPSAPGNQAHNALMQMQMQQLRALKIEQQQQLAAIQQTTEKPKPKRRRKKKKSQAEKEAEEQQALMQQQQQQQMQNMQQQTPLPGSLPITHQPQPGTTWFHRQPGPMTMNQPLNTQMMRPQITSQHQQQHPRFGVVSVPVQMHPGPMGSPSPLQQNQFSTQHSIPSQVITTTSHIASVPTLSAMPAGVIQSVQPPSQHIMSTSQTNLPMMSPSVTIPGQVPSFQSMPPGTLPPSAASIGSQDMILTQSLPVSVPASTVTSKMTTGTPVLAEPFPIPKVMKSIPPPTGSPQISLGPPMTGAMTPTSAPTPLLASTPTLSKVSPTAGTTLSSKPVGISKSPNLSSPQTSIITSAMGQVRNIPEVPQAAPLLLDPSKPIITPTIAVVASASSQSYKQKVTPPKSSTVVGVSISPVHNIQSRITTPSHPQPPIGMTHDRSSPRTQSPGHSVANFEGLSESEIAILMAHDPDLNPDSTPKTPLSAPLTPSAVPLYPPFGKQDSPNDEAKKKKRVKKGYVMDEKAINTIDSSINTVIRLSVEYEDRLQAESVKGIGERQVTPSPWILDPKPTKFPPKKPESRSPGGDNDPSKSTNEELLKHLLKKGPMSMGVQGGPGMYGQVSSAYGHPGMMQAVTSDMIAYGHPNMAGMGLMSYTMKPPDGDVDPGQKKKRSRKSSKETGPDGKPKRRRRKDSKNSNQQFPIGAMVEGGMMMQGPATLRTLGGKPGTVVQFPGGHITVGQISPGQVGAADIAKQWKPLPLLRLIEPDIRRTHHMCVPKGTGLTECKLFLGGEIGTSSYKGIPDLYEILLKLEKEESRPPNPPTPPASLPPSPTRKQQENQAKMSTIEAKTETTSSFFSTPASSTPDKPSTLADRSGPLGLTLHDSSQAGIALLHPPQVKVPDSLPTPPHQGIEDKDDLNLMRPAEDIVMAPSSPEMEDEDDWSPHTLTSLRNHDYEFVMRTPHIKSEKIRDSPSPALPLMFCPKIKVPTDIGRGQPPLSDKDSVSVTIEFDNANIKSIEKSLTLLSRILDTSIISYNVTEMIRPDKKMKELNQAIKEEQAALAAAIPTQATQINQNQPEEIITSNLAKQRRCIYCTTIVNGNGVRKPQFDDSIYEEDVAFCNKDCYLKSELFEKKPSVAPTKKKFKASHIYQRHTQKITMAALLEKYPDEEPLTPSKNTRFGSVESTYFPSGVNDPSRGFNGEGRGRGRGRRRGPGDEPKIAAKRWKGLRWKKWSVNVTVVKSSNKPPVDVDALMAKYGSALKPSPELVDRRVCVFCGGKGDGDTHTIARLLNVDVDRWVHLNCALWSAEVYETQGGALINVDLALRRSESVFCGLCQKKGATIHCHRPRCVNTYHCQCALDIKCVFFKDKTVLCPTHAPKPGTTSGTGFSMHQHHYHSGDTLRSLAVFRKVYVQRPETKQIASIMQQGELSQGEKNYMLRVGALIFENVGQLATHQMENCHSKSAIYPIGYKATRMYWSTGNMRRRCKYECTISEVDGKPLFTMNYNAALPGKNKPDKILTHSDTVTKIDNSIVNDLWLDILKPLEKLRSQHSVLKLFPDFINGEKLFGLTTPVVSRILESLPNIELCSEYKFRYGRTPLLEVPLAINPTGCARSEPHIKQHRKKPHTLISNLISEYYESSGIGDASSLYGKQFVHSKSSQYRKMKLEWRSNVYLARSRIQGLGLFSARDIEPGTMVIEYIGDIIRIEVSENREKMYEAQNRGVYMFRLDSDHIVDATVTGGPARYINHSCQPNCVAEVVNFEKEKKIMIVSNRHILKGEELSYDYKFDFEDEGRKIPCLCGASNCKKWMN
ncbi:histone-lysine N-methyltransferase 2C-like isoform X2 [Styela clava]